LFFKLFKVFFHLCKPNYFFITKHMQIKVAKVLSYIFNPLLMPTLGVVLIFYSGTYLSLIPQEGKNLILSVVFTGTFVVPLCFIPLYMYLKIIRNIEMESRGQRMIPYIVTFVAYCCTFYLIRRIPIPFINSFIFGTCMTLLLNTGILIKWKISSHMIGAGGIVGLIFGLIFRLNADILFYLNVSLVISGLLATSRIILQSHKPKEVYSGFFLGLAVVGFFVILV
jgi:hypothetical protein